MSKLRRKFSKKKWQDCCGKFCEDCNIAKAYKNHFGKTEGKKNLKKDFKKLNKSI